MRLVVTVAQSLGRNMGVNLRGRQAAMAQKFLDAADVGSVIQQVRGETVAQAVRAGLRIEPGLGEILPEQSAHAADVEARAVLVEENRIALAAAARPGAAGAPRATV